MKSHTHEIDDVLRVEHKGQEVLARVAGYVDSLDSTAPLFVNLRISGGLRWGQRAVKITPDQIRGTEPNWYAEQHAKFEASIKAVADAHRARMTPAEREQLRKREEYLRTRSPLQVAIDRACGLT
jgi:hypothetical protein